MRLDDKSHVAFEWLSPQKFPNHIAAHSIYNACSNLNLELYYRRLFLMESKLPVLDLSHFTSGSDSQRIEFARSLVSSFKKDGFCKLVSHGLSEDAVNKIFSLVHPLYIPL